MLCPNCGKEHIGYECPNCSFDYSTDKQSFDSTNNKDNSYNNEFQYCCYCGNKLTHNSNFCPYCGKQLTNVSCNYNTNDNNANNNTFNSFNQDNGVHFSSYSNKVTSNYQNKKNEYPKRSPVLPVILIVLMIIINILSTVLIIKNFIKINYYTSSNSKIVNFDEDNSTPTINSPKPKKDYISIYPNGVSVNEFKRLKVGMTYEQVSYIIGGDGVVSSSSNNQTVITWISEYDIKDSYVSITFTDNKVSKIEDFNLF